MSERRRSRPAAPHERRVFLLALAAGLPGVVGTGLLLWLGDYSARVTWTAMVFVAGTWLVAALVLRERVVRPLQTLSNMLAALRERDFSLRARVERPDDALGLALLEINMLGDTLRAQRLGAVEATALLRAVMAEIDVAIFAFDAQNQLRLANRAAERLLGKPAERLVGRQAASLGLAAMLTGDAPRVHTKVFPGGAGRWEVRRSTFRQDGRPHTLLVVSDVSRTLREEELLAWQRLVRVLSHEINNSLAPIKSIAGSLTSVVERASLPEDSREDLTRGLGVIGSRAEALSRFMAAYARLARLPAPQRRRLSVGEWIRRVAALETRLPVRVVAAPDAEIFADADQLDQALINLVRNAADAALTTGGRVEVTWSADDDGVEVTVRDEGPGLPVSSNLFVPFFTTKPEGSGIGLVLSRQVAEAHGGLLTLENRNDGPGCVARLRIPEGSTSGEGGRTLRDGDERRKA